MTDQKKKFFIIDFDSTFAKVESLDELLASTLAAQHDGEEIIKEIKKITDLGMEGGISFKESLVKRVAFLKANKKQLEPLIEGLKDQVSESFKRNKDFLIKQSDNIYIISSGFKDLIIPVVAEYGIKPENVYANSFVYDSQGNIVGFDETCLLSGDNGKVKQMQALNLQGEVYVIGDGYTDYEIKAAGIAQKFYAFTENVKRNSIIEIADHITPSLDEFLYDMNMPMTISYPKNRIKVLLLENIHPEGQKIFSEEGYQVEIINRGLDEDELAEAVKDVSILGIRSKTHVTAKVLENAKKLLSVGAFCIGTNQIDLQGCLKKGVTVFNAPYSNTRSVVELAIGEIIMLMRGVVERSNKLHNGVWDKSAGNSFEIRGKSLGIIGYGNIGAQLSVLAEAMGMKVYYYDIVEKLALGNAVKCKTMHELLSVSDVVTLHVDGRKSNQNIIGKAEFDAMKKGVIFLNLSRGHVVDIPALIENLKSGKILGAGVDVYPQEPKSNSEPFVSELKGFQNVILSPHVGGSTQEAQVNIANFVPNKIIEYINTGNTYSSVNFPNLQLPEFPTAHRLIHIHANYPGILAKINNVLAKNHINIVGQYLKTNETVGYVITDIDKEYNKDVIKELKSIEHTIRFRVLY
ncbi:MAG TPA: phosphoglycerate dehydrogenase [Cytophagales bacterium]|nr:phosphoglycerate dehydrogenase [Cytophagales bacterium]